MTANLVASVFVAACLLISQLELSAFAEDPDPGLRIALVEPEAEANVVFGLPERGLKARTDVQGQASFGSIRVTQIPGPYNATVVASVARATAAATIPQSNPTTAKSSKRSGRLKWILIGAAAAGAVVAVILLKKEKDPVVTVGAPTVGNPQ